MIPNGSIAECLLRKRKRTGRCCFDIICSFKQILKLLNHQGRKEKTFLSPHFMLSSHVVSIQQLLTHTENCLKNNCVHDASQFLFHPRNILTPDNIVSTIIYSDNFFPFFSPNFFGQNNSIIFHYCFDAKRRVEVNLFLSFVDAKFSVNPSE